MDFKMNTNNLIKQMRVLKHKHTNDFLKWLNG